MIIEAFALAAAVSAAQPVQPGYLNRYSSVRNVAGCPVSVNGRAWVPQSCCSCEQPGPAYYGAQDTGQIVYARVGTLTVGISPWQRWNDESFPMLEAARQQWLAEHGYSGGVRTFMNDAAMPADRRAEAGDATPEWKREFTPRLIIPIPDDLPRIRSRMEVDASKVREALERLGGAPQRVPVVVPPTIVASR